VGQVFLGVNLKCASCHDSFVDQWRLTDAYGLAAVIAEQPLEIHRCDVPQNQFATASFLFPELGQIDADADRATRLNQLARLVTMPDNGRFARTIVNRLWQRMLGYGLVEPVDAMSSPAWDEDLLEYLAADLVSHGYDLKHTLRRIANSAAYQSRTANPPPPGEPFRFRGPLARRLTAEQWMDAVWQLTGQYPATPAVDLGQRGSMPVRASLVNATRLMRVLGRPNREQVVSTRPNDLTTLEAIDLTNGQEISETLIAGSESLAQRFAGESIESFTRWLYGAALARQPTAAELEIARTALGEKLDPPAVADLLWAIVVQPEFCFVR
jgi:hypothetical protein